MERKRVLFGTDGVRDVANMGKMTPETALMLGRAMIRTTNARKIVVGTDTRTSSPMLSGALMSGMSSEGAEVFDAGIIPTPGVSYAVKSLSADGGAVISASHNPPEYNGIKFLGADGCKLSDDDELSIEDEMKSDSRNTSPNIGRIHDLPGMVKEFAAHTAEFLNPEAVPGWLAFDCANGAASVTVPFLADCGKFPGRVDILSYETDGANINRNCGVMHMSSLSEYVKSNGLDIGFAFDGDADRVLISDRRGRIIDGDIILWTLGRWLKRTGNMKVVVTVMSNKALERHFTDEGIETFRCPVGDRYVLEAMRNTGAKLGGEQSGHIIASEFTSTGDGLCTAVLFLNAVKDLDEDTDTLVDRFGRYPQKLTNIPLKRPREEVDMTAVDGITDEYVKRNPSGRIFTRMSGTEPLMRILVEAPEAGTVEILSEELALRISEYC